MEYMIKKVCLASILFFVLMHCNAKDVGDVIIKGKVKNANQEYVVLSYASRARGILNYDGFKSVGTKIDREGNFVLSTPNVTNASYYDFFVKDKVCSLILFNGDNIKLEFDLNNIDSSLFATGKGAGKINVLKLQQFKPDLPFETQHTMNDCKLRVDSMVTSQLSLLELIYKRDSGNKAIINAANKELMSRIIQETPLSTNEYEFLETIITLQKFRVASFLSYLCEVKRADTLQIDFSNTHFNSFNGQEYKKINTVTNWKFADALENILKVEYLRNKYKDHPELNYSKWNSQNEYNQYDDWAKSFIKANFNAEVFDMYYADELGFEMTLGPDWDKPYEYFKEHCNNGKYLNRINKFKDLLENGLNDTEYHLNLNKFTLTSSKLDSLIESYKNKPVYLIIWSAQFAGASVIPCLPSIIDFEKENKGKIEVINICIDGAKYKNLWAARIIDNSWKGNHFFLPKEGNESIINKFNAKKIFAFCYAGVTYTLINTHGTFINNIESPLILTNEKTNEYLKRTVSR